jgi:ADP-ribosylglycohydrolase
MRTKTYLLLQAVMFVLLAVIAASAVCAAKVTINEAEFRDKVYACWLGKSIGGTLGMPLEGSRSMHDLSFFDPIPEKQLPNDDLDLQLLWLKALQERGTDMNARILGEYWLKYVPVDWNEYGIGKMNMKRGILPPVSGQYANNKWRDSNGAWIRSEIWACVAPGCPSLAARYAYEDASVDHGGAEGTFAEVFTATVESAAFVESDVDKLLDIGLSYIPKNCETALCIRTARDAKNRGLDLVSARELMLKTGKTDWFMAPRNVAYVVLGWLYGEGDFGKSICAAVNCGDDTDCTGATLGSILGIIHGSKFIPDNWRKPVGESITNVAISGSNPPANLKDLTDQTVAMAKRVLADNKAPVIINDNPTGRNVKQRLKLTDSKVTRELWSRTPYQLIYKLGSVRVTLDTLGDPEIKPDTPLKFNLILENSGNKPADITANWRMDSTVKVTPLTVSTSVPPKSRIVKTYKLQLVPGNEGGMTHGTLDIAVNGSPAVSIPISLVRSTSVSANDLALAKRGAKATSDSELDREPGCTAKAIDGIINSNEFESNRWHSTIATPHPHWITVELPAVKSIRKCILHFADPAGHPEDFYCEVSRDGTNWQRVAEENGYTDRYRYEKNIGPVECRFFRLTITKSANPAYANAAQIAEIELLKG